MSGFCIDYRMKISFINEKSKALIDLIRAKNIITEKDIKLLKKFRGDINVA